MESPSQSDHEAAAWLARRDRGFAPKEQDAFFEWLAADAAHGEALARQQRTVSRLRVLAQWRPEHANRPNPDLLATPPMNRLSHYWPLGVLGALAVVIALAFILRETAPVPAIDPAPSGVVRKVLEDGSTIDLNQGAEVEVSYTADTRSVQLLRGEATFAVTKNPERPFIVEAADIRVRAVGTAFNVNMQGDAISVLVTEGRVAVSNSLSAGAKSAMTGNPPAFAPIFLEAGERTLVAGSGTAPSIFPVSSEEMARVLAWQPRVLEFNDAPLAQVVAEFNVSNQVKLVVDDPALASLPIGASLRSDNVEGFVRLLESSFAVDAERRSDHTIVLRAARRK